MEKNIIEIEKQIDSIGRKAMGGNYCGFFDNIQIWTMP